MRRVARPPILGSYFPVQNWLFSTLATAQTSSCARKPLTVPNVYVTAVYGKSHQD